MKQDLMVLGEAAYLGFLPFGMNLKHQTIDTSRIQMILMPRSNLGLAEIILKKHWWEPGPSKVLAFTDIDKLIEIRKAEGIELAPVVDTRQEDGRMVYVDPFMAKVKHGAGKGLITFQVFRGPKVFIDDPDRVEAELMTARQHSTPRPERSLFTGWRELLRHLKK